MPKIEDIVKESREAELERYIRDGISFTREDEEELLENVSFWLDNREVLTYSHKNYIIAKHLKNQTSYLTVIQDLLTWKNL